MTAYRLVKIHDLLLVPADRRTDCLHEIQLSLLLHELAFGDKAHATKVRAYEWTDDGDASSKITQPDGSTILHMKVSKE